MSIRERKRTRRAILLMAAFVVALPIGTALADHEHDLPEGPIRDRHELMESIGAHAKKIGAARKEGDLATIATEAGEIHAQAAKVTPLFPAGSTHENSRALPAIWEKWSEFEEGAKSLEATSKKLQEAAQAGGDVQAAVGDLFEACKSCHDAFRQPEE